MAKAGVVQPPTGRAGRNRMNGKLCRRRIARFAREHDLRPRSMTDRQPRTHQPVRFLTRPFSLDEVKTRRPMRASRTRGAAAAAMPQPLHPDGPRGSAHPDYLYNHAARLRFPHRRKLCDFFSGHGGLGRVGRCPAIDGSPRLRRELSRGERHHGGTFQLAPRSALQAAARAAVPWGQRYEIWCLSFE